MSKAKDHQIHNWKEFFFPPNAQVVNREEETSVLQLVNQWRRRFLLFILVLLTIVTAVFGLDNLLHLHRDFFGYLLLASSLCLGFATYRVHQSSDNILVFQLIASGIIVIATTAGTLANGILPMVLFAAIIVSFYMLLPTTYALIHAMVAFVANTTGLLISEVPFEWNMFNRVVVEALIILPLLHFYACLSNWLLSYYSKTLKTRTRFIGAISHELRSPLNGLTGLLHLSKDLSQSDKEVDKRALFENLEKMQDLQLHLAQVIGDTLDFNQLRVGKLSIHLEPLELTKFIQNAVGAFKATCDSKGLTLICDYPSRLDGIFIHSDGLRLRQILFNFISNAIKYTKEGKIRVEFDLIESKPNQHLLQIGVFDTGIGIPKHKLSEVFQEYSQLHSDNAYAENSTGLGLSLVQELVNAFSGRCGVNSTEGIGSHFWCRIPVEKLAIETSPKGPANHGEVKHLGEVSTNHSNSTPELHHLTILVAEDESINRKVISKILRKYGVNVLEASDGPSALAVANDDAHCIDMFLVDLHMPGLNGLEVMQQIRQISHYQKTPAICISGALIECDEDHPVGRGFDEFVCKPINPEALISKICYYSLLQVVANSK